MNTAQARLPSYRPDPVARMTRIRDQALADSHALATALHDTETADR